MAAPLRLLFVEDDLVDQMAFRRLVKEQELPYAYEMASSVAKAKRLLATERYDVIVSDYKLEDGTAFEFFNATGETPLIFATGAGDEETAVQAMKRGAYDYLIKDSDRNYLKILPMTVASAIRQKQAELELEASRALLESVLESSLDGIMAFRAVRHDEGEIVDFEWVLANAQSEALTGRNIDDLMGRRLLEELPGNATEGLFHSCVRVVETGKPFKHEIIYHHDGIRAWFELVAVKLDDGFAVTFRNITELKQAEADLHRAHDAALESARLKAEFLANMSHEIRTPMNGVIGMTDLLMDTTLSGEQRELTGIIRSSGEALLTLVDDVLDYSKIEAGKLELEHIAFDLLAPVEGALKLFAEQAYGKGIELGLFIDADVPRLVHGDPGRVRQVLINLFGNAVKFTESGEVILHVTRTRTSDHRTTVHFAVADTGIGIPEEAQGHLFEAFMQADGSTTRRFGGTGLGLAISRQLVQLMGGEIGFESQPGTGSTFWFTVPLELQAEAQPGPPAALQGERVLIVERNEAMGEVLRRQLACRGLQVETASTPAQALGRLRALSTAGRPFHVAVLDDPGLISLIRQTTTLDATRLVLTVHFNEREAATQADCDALLFKPVRLSQLLDALTDGVHAPAAKAAPAASEAASPAANAGTRLLIVEDNPVNQRVAQRQAEKLGYRVDLVANGREALEALSRRPYALVLMDCQMPVMDGYNATTELRRREEPQRHTIVIAMTAHAMQGDREKCLMAGMDDYISKPVRTEALRELLDHWLERPVEASTPEADDQPLWSTSAPDDRVVTLCPIDGLELLDELVAIFIDYTTTQLDIAREALAEGRLHDVEHIAHSLKGSCGTLGLTALGAHCDALERLCHQGDVEQARAAYGPLETAFRHLQRALRAGRYVGRSPASRPGVPTAFSQRPVF